MCMCTLMMGKSVAARRWRRVSLVWGTGGGIVKFDPVNGYRLKTRRVMLTVILATISSRHLATAPRRWCTVFNVYCQCCALRAADKVVVVRRDGGDAAATASFF